MYRLAVLAALAGTAAAQTKPVMRCADLRSLTNNEVSIAIATMTDGHCRVAGQVIPQVGFEVHLPDSWNGRFVMNGGGGWAGGGRAYCEVADCGDVLCSAVAGCGPVCEGG